MPDIRRLDDQVSVAPQLDPAELADVRTAGFVTLINNRPDGEEAGQPEAVAIRAAAEAAGLGYHEIPVGQGGIGHYDLDAMAAALEAGPALAFCRSGTRSCNLWALARAKGGDDPAELIAKAAGAGYDLRGLAPTLNALSGAALAGRA